MTAAKARGSLSSKRRGGGIGDLLAIISRLELGAADRRRIETIRRRGDPMHPYVAAHFTYVFPFDGPGLDEVRAHAAGVAGATAAIPFRLVAARAVPDATAPRSHVFLVPGEGGDKLHRLHDRLYTGPLAATLRRDIPYIPHVTVGAFPEHAEAERAAAAIGPADIAGTVSALELTTFDGRDVTIIARFRLSLE